jgi:hypothetical protein
MKLLMQRSSSTFEGTARYNLLPLIETESQPFVLSRTQVNAVQR